MLLPQLKDEHADGWLNMSLTGHSGLAVACLTAVREVLVSNHAVGSCVYRTTTAIYSLGHELCAPFLQCLGQLSLLPSVEGKWVSAFGLSNNNK